MKHVRHGLIGIGFLALFAPDAAAQTQMASVRELYASASYEEALSVLTSVSAPGGPTLIEAEQYRALCLLAVGRQAEARDAVRRIVEQDPLYVPAGDDVSPRIAALFEEVRGELLPTIARKQFAEAKALFGQQEHQRASEMLDRVVRMTTDPIVKDAAGLEDLRLVADGLLTLATAKIAPVPVAGPAGPEVPATPRPATPVVYSSNNKEVSVPEAVSQQLPEWRPPASLRSGFVLSGLLRLIISESGSVEAVSVLRSAHPSYDAALVKAAHDWKFRPALKDGQPVKYAKVIQVQLRE